MDYSGEQYGLDESGIHVDWACGMDSPFDWIFANSPPPRGLVCCITSTECDDVEGQMNETQSWNRKKHQRQKNCSDLNGDWW